MRHFDYRDNELFAEDIAVSEIAESVGTPLYIYSTATLKRHFRVFAQGFAHVDALVAFAVKANSNLSVLRVLAKEGAGADVVSGGELYRAMKAGIDPQKIVFSGVGKTDDEMHAALSAGIFQFNVESAPELERLSHHASDMGTHAPIAFRVNPDIAAGAHEKISTGKKDNKFGIAWEDAMPLYARAAELSGIKVQGVDVHIGSQITDLDPFDLTIGKVKGLITDLRSAGHSISTFDLGGGLGIPYGDGAQAPAAPADYAKMVLAETADLNVKLIFEPGRMIAGNAGILVSKVIFDKPSGNRRFLVVDAAMNDLIRPALYGAFHEIAAVRKRPGRKKFFYDVVGPVCETGDLFAKDRELPELKRDELVVFHSAGAYGAVQSSQYNSRQLVPEVLVDGSDWRIIRRRPTIDEMLDLES